MTQKITYICTKCKSHEFETGEIRTTGSGLSRFFNLQNQKFQTISCVKCGYTDIYRMKSGALGNIVDFLGG